MLNPLHKGKMDRLPDEYIRPSRFEGDPPVTIRPYSNRPLQSTVEDKRDLRDPESMADAISYMSEQISSLDINESASQRADYLPSIFVRNYGETPEQFDQRIILTRKELGSDRH